jgi:hypothetical protein
MAKGAIQFTLPCVRATVDKTLHGDARYSWLTGLAVGTIPEAVSQLS